MVGALGLQEKLPLDLLGYSVEVLEAHPHDFMGSDRDIPSRLRELPKAWSCEV